MSTGAQIRKTLRTLAQSGAALILAAFLLPALLFGLAARYSYNETMSAANARVERTARLLEEHALKVFETHRLVIQQVADRIRFVDWSKEEDRKKLHERLKFLQTELDQIATITVVDAGGKLRASSRMYPVDASVDYNDRDWFQSIRTYDPPLPIVSKSYTGRQSGQAVFNLVGRIPPKEGEAFAGAIAVSVDRGYFEDFYKKVEPGFDNSTVLVRKDGQVLAAAPPAPVTVLSPDAMMMQLIKEAPSGRYRRVSRFDGVDRIFAYRKIENYPVYVRYGVSKDTALASWRSALLSYGVVALLASLALIGASGLAVMQTNRERVARHRWEETAAALQAEAEQRGRVEEQLRQSQKMEAVGRLTGGVAHDFNNLLTAVIGSLDLVQRRPAGIDARNASFINNALEGAKRAAALTNRLLAFSRQQPLQPIKVDSNKLVAGMSDLLQRTIGENIVIETVLAGGLWSTLADPNQLESALLNLAVNARDAMPSGGKLTLETANAYLDEAYARDRTDVAPGQYVMVAVSDTGTGMSADVMSKVFDPFFTTKAIGKGTGLGLSQVYGFAKQSGGHISVYSEPGQGSTFKLYLPRLRAEAVPRVGPTLAPAVQGERAAARGETILVVEDESMVRQLSVAALEEAGFRVLEAADGPKGLDLFRQNSEIALLFTDVVLTGPMNGRNLADAILTERGNLPVLFTTGYTRNAIIHHGRLDEGVNFIGKPFTSEALVAKVGDLLAASREAAVAPSQD